MPVLKKKKIISSTPSNVMIDLETLGQHPGCSILSIGAVAFNPTSGELDEGFYVVVSRTSCREAGLLESQDTIDWWAKQAPEAREVIDVAESTEAMSLSEAMLQLTCYLTQFGLTQLKVWGNGADFDNAILNCCYAAVEQHVPWKFWHNRCYRTLKSIVPGPEFKRQGTYHNALDDARSQALHAIQLLR